MGKRDEDFLLRAEKAIEERYGKEASQNVKAKWTLDQEREFLQQAKEVYSKKVSLEKEPEFIEVDGVLIQKDLFIKDNSCPKCGSYSFKANDDFYLTRHDCCEKCFIRFVEGREK